MVEAKFHNLPGTKTDVHVSLYTKARFDDLKEKNGLTKAILITNTKMTVDAISYADCVGLNLISWNYPNEENLRDLIEKQNLHPVTQLDSITTAQKKILLENHIVVCKDITDKNLAILSLQPKN